jgi:hypothetical protein
MSIKPYENSASETISFIACVVCGGSGDGNRFYFDGTPVACDVCKGLGYTPDAGKNAVAHDPP